jgi:4'-phosphopantetheinyl transferase
MRPLSEPVAQPPWSPHEVHVWRVPLDCGPDVPAQLRSLLSADELERAARFHFDRDRNRFTVGRAKLRLLLAGYLGLDAANLNFHYGPAGKPELPPPGPPFSVSHSAGLMLIAVGGPGRLGVDIEEIRPRTQSDSLAGFFAPAEEAAIRALPLDLRERAFFACWTRKEAWLKGLGDGLSFGLERFEVSVHPDLPASLLQVADHPEEVSRWELRSLDPAPGYAGALAVEGHGWGLREFLTRSGN